MFTQKRIQPHVDSYLPIYFALEESDIDESAVEVEDLEDVSPDGEVIFVLELSFMIFPLRHGDSILGVVLAHDDDQSKAHHACTNSG